MIIPTKRFRTFQEIHSARKQNIHSLHWPSKHNMISLSHTLSLWLNQWWWALVGNNQAANQGEGQYCVNSRAKLRSKKNRVIDLIIKNPSNVTIVKYQEVLDNFQNQCTLSRLVNHIIMTKPRLINHFKYLIYYATLKLKVFKRPSVVWN